MSLHLLSRIYLQTAAGLRVLFLLRYDGQSAWITLFIISLQLLCLGLALRTWIAPFILTALSKRIRIGSISLRSIRRLYIRTNGLIIRVDRIGFSYHDHSSLSSTRRFSLKLEGLYVGLDNWKAPNIQQNNDGTGGPDSLRHLHHIREVVVSSISQAFWYSYSACYAAVEPFARPLIRTCFVASLRILIRCLPVLTQSFDVEIASALVSLSEIPSAYIAIRGTTLSAEVSFFAVEDVITLARGPRHSQEVHRYLGFLNMAHMRFRLRASARRVLERAWGRTRGRASFGLRVQELSLMAIEDSSSRHAESPKLPADRFEFVMGSENQNLRCLSLPKLTVFTASFDFGPRRRILEEKSLEVSLKISTVLLSNELLRDFLRLVNKSGKNTGSEKISTKPLTKHSGKDGDNVNRELQNGAFQFTLFKSAKLIISDLVIRTGVSYGSPLDDIQFRGEFSDLSYFLTLEESDIGPFHHGILGKRIRENSELDPDILSMQFTIGEIAVYRFDGRRTAPLSRSISIGQVKLLGFATQWAPLRLGSTRHFFGDPNASVLAMRLDIMSPQFNERIDVVNRILDELNHAPNVSDRKSNKRRLLHSIPRIKFELSVNDVAACLSSYSKDTGRSSTLVLSSTQSFMSLSTQFLDSFTQTLAGEYETAECTPLRMVLTSESILGPASVSIMPGTLSLDRDIQGDFIDERKFGEVLLTLDVIETVSSGTAPGSYVNDGTVIDLDDALLDVHFRADAVSIELWRPSTISTLKDFLSFLREARVPLNREKRPTSSKLPSGLRIRVSASQLGCLLVGEDLTNEGESSLRRGVSVSTAASIELNTTHDTQILAHSRNHLSCLINHQKLFMSNNQRDDSKANALTDHDTGNAFLRCAFYRTVMRTAHYNASSKNPTSFGYDESLALGTTELINIDALETKIASQHNLSKDTTTGQSVIEISTNIHYIHSLLELSDFYCLLLSVSTISSLAGALKKSDVSAQQSSSQAIQHRLSIGTIQCLLDLPLGEEICCRIDNVLFERKGYSGFSAHWDDLLLWVPIRRGDLKWEELAYLRSWTVSVILGSQPVGIHVTADVARLSVPYEYVLADLVLNVNVFVKCFRHLRDIIPKGELTPIPSPGPEDAKNVPNITLKIKTLIAEAADDPLEARFGLIWRAGLNFARSRIERDEAFDAKVSAIREAEGDATYAEIDAGTTRFTPQHTVSVEDAYERLLQVHSISWISLHRELREEQRRKEDDVRRQVRDDDTRQLNEEIKPLVHVRDCSQLVPLVRVVLSDVDFAISNAFNDKQEMTSFLNDIGSGVPQDTLFTLLIPLHVRIKLGSSSVLLRDYPLPLMSIRHDERSDSAWSVETDIVFGEELGSTSSVVWKDCSITFPDLPFQQVPINISVPKTTMPVKTYMNPIVSVTTSYLTEFCWCVSYSPAIQDMMRVIDSFSTPPPDPSPSLGFWDKIKLQFHCRADFSFSSEVNLYLKGSRDPYEVDGNGAGFAFCWEGNTQMTIGKENPQKELLQVISDTMSIVIPDLRQHEIETQLPHNMNSFRGDVTSRRFLKVCAKFSSGIRWGIGAILERTCSVNCRDCNNSFACRLFDSRPHYEIILEPKVFVPEEKTTADSFDGFRSDFIHLSTSLATGVRSHDGSNSFHLSPKVFAHFWSWWDLFDRSLTLPVRQGKLFPNARPPSKKFGRHLATLKYRLAVSQLFISHIYMDDSRETWTDGVTNFVGLKAYVSSFEADMHQREQEGTIPDVARLTLKKIRHKPFYAAEVKLSGLQVQAILATFQDQLKCAIEMGGHQRENRFSNAEASPLDQSQRKWIDRDDFEEVDWIPADENPSLHIFPIGSCPRFSYFRRSSGKLQQAVTGSRVTQTIVERSRFGDEDTHVCLMGKEPSVNIIQSQMISDRILVLERELLLAQKRHSSSQEHLADISAIEKKISLLKRHLAQLNKLDEVSDHSSHVPQGDFPNYLIPSDESSPAEWTEYDNVYQFHCPKFSMNNCVREILMQYYYCSRARRGFEYHMASRAVKFIRDQANAFAMAAAENTGKDKKYKNAPGAAAQATVLALKKILTGNEGDNVGVNSAEVDDKDESFDPMDGWSEGVSLNRSHFCLLLKPQVLLSETSRDSVVVLTAVQAVLQSCAILDTVNADDPISGRIMTRSHAVLSGLQAFSPSITCPSRHDGVPLEVLIDLRAESDLFDRLVPQTRATFRYDKFNRLRLRNRLTSVADKHVEHHHAHLQNQTDLVSIRVPRFTVSADSRNFESIANIITDLLLQTDSAHKIHLNQVETLLFSYDFTDFSSSADVVEGLQDRLRRTVERAKDLQLSTWKAKERENVEAMALKARIFLLSEELNLIFDAIKLAQDKADDKHSDSKSALQVHAWSKEISWDMVNEVREIIAKLAVRGVDYTWLNRQDGSTVNKLNMIDFQAFDGSQDAEWPEVLLKYREPASHPLVKMGIFAQVEWTVLAPVGGIAIYESFIARLHPMRLQLEARIGKNMMEYVWPARRARQKTLGPEVPQDADDEYLLYDSDPEDSLVIRRASVDTPHNVHGGSLYRKRNSGEGGNRLGTRQMTASRSFTDLRSSSRQNSQASTFTRVPSGTSVNEGHWLSDRPVFAEPKKAGEIGFFTRSKTKELGDAAEMKSRSLQKHFVHVLVPSMHIILSFHKDGSFFCRDARIQTRELEFRNRTLSFEELAEQFIPSDTSWRGWMRMALHQPLVPVLPVAKELFSKTKWIATKGKSARKSTARLTKARPRKSGATEDTDTQRPSGER